MAIQSPMRELDYGFHRSLDCSFEDALARTREALKTEGFGVLCEIDVKNTLKEKLGVDFRNYKILGACNPALAHHGLQAEIELGLLLPCNVIVYEDNGKCIVSMIDANKMLSVVGNKELLPIAKVVNEKLGNALENL
jgi:uncharacterized protein (DUF302 family)